MKHIILFGIQGSGKSTQGNLLSQVLHIPYISTGHTFRHIATEHTRLGRYVKELLQAGSLIPDDITLQVVEEVLSRPEYANGFILDGFPRTLAQAKTLKFPIDAVFYFALSDKDALWRLSMRHDTGVRADNTLQAVQHRINLFHENTASLIEYFKTKDVLVTLDATETIEMIHQRILEKISYNSHNKTDHVKSRKKRLICVVGMAGSGKTEATDYITREFHFPVVHFGNVVNEYIDKHKLEHTEIVHKKVRLQFRQEHGMEALAVLRTPQIDTALHTSDIVVINGLYSWEEYWYLRKVFSTAEVVLLAIYADKRLRYERSKHRAYRPGLAGEERDINEINTINKAPPIAFADYLVKNNFALESFYDKIAETVRAIIYT